MLKIENISPGMLSHFQHCQCINQKYICTKGVWEIVAANELREWNTEKRIRITNYLQEQVAGGGSLIGAFFGDTLVGFCCMGGSLQGSAAKYANLTMLFVDDRFWRKGIGQGLFQAICKCALEKGAEKLFISAIPSVETVAFYFSMGCTDAGEVIAGYIDTENDRYLEYQLK